MKRLSILEVLFALVVATSEALCAPVLISVELPTIESKKAWHLLNIPTYELIGNTAIAEAEESQIAPLVQKVFQLAIIDHQPNMERCIVVTDYDSILEIMEKPVWQNNQTAIIKMASKEVYLSRELKHKNRPMNSKPLGDRFWKSVTTINIPLKSIPYDPFIQSLVDQVNADSIASYIQRLQDFKTRKVFTDSSCAAAQWLFDKYVSYGCNAEFDSIYMHKPTGDSGYERSVIGYIPGYIPQAEIIVSGHFDSESYPNPDSCAPGADDNASGTAAAIEVARILSKQSYPVKIACAAWAAEEAGLKGSIHYADWADTMGTDIRAILNMDMIGYVNDSNYDCITAGVPWLTELYVKAAQIYAPLLVIYPKSGAISDDARFYNLGYSSLGCIQNPMSGDGFNPYYHSVNDLLDKLSPIFFTEITKTAIATILLIELSPSKVLNVIVDQTYSGTSLAVQWTANPETDIAGYWIWWGTQSGLYGDSLYVPGRGTSNDTLTGLEPSQVIYLIVRAVNGSGYLSYLADEVSGIPVIFSLDQGILAVDETYNWTTGNMPRDAQQDSFYTYIMNGYKCMQYEYGSADQKPNLSNFSTYSTIVWFADDYTALLSSGAMDDLMNYLDHGGKLWFVGWKPTADIRNSATYPASFAAGDLLYDHFKISSAELSGTTDSFKTAVGLKGYPDISVDTLKFPATIWGKVFHNIEALTPLAGADTIYVIDMKNSGSGYEGRACAVRDSGKTVLFGFPMYFMDKDQAKLAAQKVMAEFGEPYTGVEGKPEDSQRITDFRLLQNSPNPFNQSTKISYQLAKSGLVNLKIYNIAGQLVKTLVNGIQPKGSHNVKWDGQDESGNSVSNGVYIYWLQAGIISQTRKMIVLR
jgi:hypothetical protein